ncbi:MAG: DUF1697 domain-containing protein [Bdellovibrionia bacterium]
MPRYVAFLRGVSPMNLKMPELKKCLEQEGFTDVVTVLSSGNAVFDSRGADNEALERRIEKATEQRLGRGFSTIVRSVSELQKMLDSDPFSEFKLGPKDKRVVTFFKKTAPRGIKLPVQKDEASILKIQGREAFSAYQPSPGNPVFMVLIEKTFGNEITTRTWDTVRKCVSK